MIMTNIFKCIRDHSYTDYILTNLFAFIYSEKSYFDVANLNIIFFDVH